MQQAVFNSVAQLEAAVGGPAAHSDWLAITQPMVDDFATLTRDLQWIHVEVERAQRESPFGTTIAHGFLVLSLLSTLIKECITLPPVRLALNYGFDRVRFVSPVPVGARIRGNFSLKELTPTADGLQLAWNAEVVVADAPKPALAAVWLSRLILR